MYQLFNGSIMLFIWMYLFVNSFQIKGLSIKETSKKRAAYSLLSGISAKIISKQIINLSDF